MTQKGLWTHNTDRWAIPLLFLLALLFFTTATADATTFDIRPTRFFFDGKSKLEKLTIKNTGDTDFPVQIKAFKWTQNEKGEDVYEETEDIITFPKILTMKKGEEKFVRIGTNTGPGPIEKTYRMYVEEIPSAEKPTEGANVRLYMKMGIPIFIKSAKDDEKADIESLSMKNGTIAVKVRNKGNCHFIATGINIIGEDNNGKQSFSREIGGWYILGGSFKVYEASIPLDVCKNTANLKIEVKTNNGLTLHEKLAVDKATCEEAHAANK